MSRADGRSYDAVRPVAVEANGQRNPEGSVMYRGGGTTVLIAASISDGVPDWMRGSGKGWPPRNTRCIHVPTRSGIVATDAVGVSMGAPRRFSAWWGARFVQRLISRSSASA